MSGHDEIHYNYSTTNNTRAANRPKAKQSHKSTKRGIQPVPDMADDKGPPPKRQKGSFITQFQAGDPLAGVDEGKSRSTSTTASAAISRSNSHASDVTFPSEALGDGLLAATLASRGTTAQNLRFTGPINEHTDFTTSLPEDALAGFDGLPLPARVLEADDVEDGVDAASRNTNVEQLRAFADGHTPAVYANCVIERYGPPSTTLRDRDLCTKCCRERHMSMPFHRVRYLRGVQYGEAWLRDTGVFIQLCPVAKGTSMCPGYTSGDFALPEDFDSRSPPSYGGAREAAGNPPPVQKRSSDAGQQGDEDYSWMGGSGGSGGSDGSAFMPDDPDDDLLPSDNQGAELDEGEADGEPIEPAAIDDRDVPGSEEGTARTRGKQARLRKDPRGLPIMVIVDKTDIHQLGVALCKCREGVNVSYDQQLIKLGGLMPATPSNPGTCFTLEALFYLQIDRLECKLAPQAMMRRLRRNTCPLHPSTVPDRYLEGLRVLREWNIIQSLITHGFAHQPMETWEPPGPGELFHSCVVCPSKKNLPRGYLNDPNSWGYFWAFVHDGNFNGQHTVSRQPGNNVPIFPGTGAFQHPDEAKRDLASVKTDQQIRKEAEHLFAKDLPCHKHVAAQITGKSRDKVTDIKGIGAWACARHGEFCAGGTCNYELGEASGPADVALNNTFKLNTDLTLLERIQLLYDIWCRYGIHLQERFNRSPNLTWPEFKEVMGSVGVWHIYGHVLECYGRWSNLYARRTGIVDGEILETLWSILNQILESCRGMSLANREEVISMFESDSNHKKNLAMVDTLVRKFEKYYAEEQERAKLVEKLSECTTKDNVQEWENERRIFERDRITDPTAADRFFKTDQHQVPSRKDAELHLLEEEAKKPEGKGLAKAIIDAVALQVDQLKLQALDKQASSPAEMRTIASTRTKIHNRVNKSRAAMSIALDSEPVESELKVIRLRKLMDEDEWGAALEPRAGPGSRGSRALRTGAEFRPVDLPSSRGEAWRSACLTEATGEEIMLRRRAMAIEVDVLIARMNETLGQIRTRMVDQANTYLHRIRSRNGNANHGYHQQNVAYKDAQDQGKAVRLNAQIYNICREKLAMLKWDTTAETDARFKTLLANYQYLTPDHLKCSTATYSTTGTSSQFTLPWFWRMVSMTARETVEEAQRKDEEFVANCKYLAPSTPSPD
ncbi:unnamed protein product [Peniophora sp. CBMAI 1063]|nr:unnamed protein product [Peniophora sp. CBMAI 1063]